MGGQTNSGKARVKRPDGRPNAKKRQKEGLDDAMERNTAQSFQAKKTKRDGNKEVADENEARSDKMQKEEMQKKLPYTTEKRIKALQKKLRQIDELKAKKIPKADMDKQQKEKLSRRGEIVKEIAALEAGELK